MDSLVPASATILVVDDDALINIGTVDMIADLGHRALEAYSGREALEIITSDDSIDLLITDYGMPGMNGLELVREARRVRPNLRVLLATGYAELPPGEHGDLPRLEKPFQINDLVASLRTVLADKV